MSNLPYVEAMRLVPPKVEEGIPTPGHSVRVYLKEFPDAYYVIFLPYNYQEGVSWPLIVESPGNGIATAPQGIPDENVLGYGITKGYDFILVGVPFVDEFGGICRSYWSSDPLTSVNYWLAVLEDLDAKFKIDKRIVCGFSRGAVSAVYIGNFNAEISEKWCAYFAHAHFDGCCQTVEGDYTERIERIKGKQILITVGSEDIAKSCSFKSFQKLINQGYNAKYIEIPNGTHCPDWILEATDEAESARHWINQFKTARD